MLLDISELNTLYKTENDELTYKELLDVCEDVLWQARRSPSKCFLETHDNVSTLQHVYWLVQIMLWVYNSYQARKKQR